MRVLAFSGGKDSMACLHLLRESLDCAIYVDTGYSYPETLALVDYARTMLTVHVVESDRKGQNEREGIPADVVPINWTNLGQQFTEKKDFTIQSYLGCCYENLSMPLFKKAQELSATVLVFGQRNDEGYKSPARNGDMVFGIKRVQPIETWTTAEVMAYLATKMDVPKHYVIKHSSLDCWDCTAYRKDSVDRVDWMREAHPDLYQRYAKRANMLDAAIKEAM